MTRTLLVRPLIVAMALTIAISGCAPAAPVGTPESPASVDEAVTEESATPKPPAAALADDVLFRISVTATAPNGAVVELVEVVQVPRALTPDDEAALDAGQCDLWRTFADPQVQDAQLTATAISGTWPAERDVFMFLGQWSLFEGDFKVFQAYCSPMMLDVPGTSSGRHVFSGTDPDNEGWATQSYGFSVDADSYINPGPDDVVLSACVIQLGPDAATASTLVQSWPAHSQDYPDFSCVFGGTS